MSKNQQTDIQQFSCAVCFDKYSVTERILCGFDGSEVERHSFCHKCIVGHAKASTEEAQLAEEGGFRCMEYGCKKSIAYSVALQKLLPKNVKERLDERIMEESLAKSGLILERCRDCNFAVEMEQSKEQNMIFPCLNCQKRWCRICGREWNHEHAKLTCAQLDAKNNTEKKQRELERELSEAVIRKCECGLHFTKAEGCNKMTCRCGITQCYICREKDIDYDHFCQHVREPGVTACHCGKKCTIWIDANKVDQVIIDRIYVQAAKEGINLRKDVNKNSPQNNGKQEEHPALRRFQQNRNVVEFFQEIYRYGNQQIQNAALEAERQRQQTLQRGLNQAEELRQQALRQGEQQRQHALHQAERQRLQAIRLAEQQRQQALHQAELCRQQAELQRQLALNQAEQKRQQYALQATLRQQENARQVEQRFQQVAHHATGIQQHFAHQAEKQRRKAVRKAGLRQERDQQRRRIAAFKAEQRQQKAERRRQKDELRRQRNAVIDEQMRQAFQQMQLRIQNAVGRVEREAGRAPRIIGKCSRGAALSKGYIMDPLDKAAVGCITSGCPSPCLRKNVAIGYADTKTRAMFFHVFGQ